MECMECPGLSCDMLGGGVSWDSRFWTARNKLAFLFNAGWQEKVAT